MYNRIRSIREERNYSQKEVASLLFMSQTGYSKYETGRHDVPTSILIKLSQLYDVSVDYMLGITHNPQINRWIT